MPPRWPDPDHGNVGEPGALRTRSRGNVSIGRDRAACREAGRRKRQSSGRTIRSWRV